MTDEVMFEIRDMTGQDYRNVYAGQAETETSTPSKVASVGDDDLESNEVRELVGVG
jgi:hypothetical protein